MTVSFNSIPNDIIMDMIVLNLEFSDVSNLALSSKYYYYNKDNIYNNIIANDKFLNGYLNNINLIKSIDDSAFSLKLFFELYDNIKNHTIKNSSIPFIDIKNNNDFITAHSIDETFKLYKLLMSLVIYKEKHQFKNFITTHMIKYFRNVYKYRHPNIKDISKNIFFYLITNRDELRWDMLNINIYYLYENGNLILFANRSYDLKNNMDNFDDGIIDNKDDSLYTIAFLVKMFEYLKNIEIRIYYMYKIFKYTKFILSFNKNLNLKNEKFIKTIKNKIETFKYDIKNDFRSKIPFSIRQKMLNEIDELNNIC